MNTQKLSQWLAAFVILLAMGLPTVHSAALAFSQRTAPTASYSVAWRDARGGGFGLECNGGSTGACGGG